MSLRLKACTSFVARSTNIKKHSSFIKGTRGSSPNSTNSIRSRSSSSISSRILNNDDDIKSSLKLILKTPEDIESFGSALGACCDAGDVLLLSGDLGAGKTTLSRGLIREKFKDNGMLVTSPSYLLDNTYEYDQDKIIHHMDLYRLPSNCDLSILGIPDIYDRCLCIIEWPERISSKFYPSKCITIQMKINNENEHRHVLIQSHNSDELLNKIKEQEL